MRQIYGLAEGSLASREGLLLKDRRLPASGRAVFPIQKFTTKSNSDEADSCLLRTLRYWTSLFVLCEELAIIDYLCKYRVYRCSRLLL
jgi:hypothetical protein